MVLKGVDGKKNVHVYGGGQGRGRQRALTSSVVQAMVLVFWTAWISPGGRSTPAGMMRWYPRETEHDTWKPGQPPPSAEERRTPPRGESQRVENV